MSVEPISPTGQGSAAAQIERQLREAIVRLQLLPGTRLSEQELGVRYGVSRQPVREALIALARTGLVAIQPNRGTMVVPISVEQVREARFVREALETMVVRRACQYFDPWARDMIGANLNQQAEAIAADDHDLFRNLDSQFHIGIAKGTGSSLAQKVINEMKAHVDRACNLTLTDRQTREALFVHHQEIVDAIDTNDPDRAERVMRAHLQSLLKDLAHVRMQHQELFED